LKKSSEHTHCSGLGGGEGNKEIFEENKLKRNFSEVIGKVGKKTLFLM